MYWSFFCAQNIIWFDVKVIYKTVIQKTEMMTWTFSYSDSLSEEYLHWVLSSPKLPRVCAGWDGWWCSDISLWRQHQGTRTQTGLDEQSHRRLSSALGEIHCQMFWSPAALQRLQWNFKASFQPNWRFVYVSLLLIKCCSFFHHHHHKHTHKWLILNKCLLQWKLLEQCMCLALVKGLAVMCSNQW